MTVMNVRSDRPATPLEGAGPLDEALFGAARLVAHARLDRPAQGDVLALVQAQLRQVLAPPPLHTAFVPRASAFADAPRGYALRDAATAGAGGAAAQDGAAAPAAAGDAEAGDASPGVSATATVRAKTSTTKSTTVTAKELAFLDDRKLSIEDKIYRFMALVIQKNDQALTDEMKQYEVKSAAAKSSSSSTTYRAVAPAPAPASGGGGGGGGGGGLFGDLFGGIASAVSSVGGAIVSGAEGLARDLGGPVLAGVATAVGMPYLAPIALQVGGTLGADLVDGVASVVGLRPGAGAAVSPAPAEPGTSADPKPAAGKSGSSKTSTTTASGDAFDEKLAMFNLQRLVEKENAMFSALSNVLKSIHESQMTAVNNIR